MIGKSGAQQIINEYVTEIGDFVKSTRGRYNFPSNWKTEVMNHINLVIHIIYTNAGSTINLEEPDCRSGIKFTYIKRGYGVGQGANVFCNRGDDILEISFSLVNKGNCSIITYNKNGYEKSLSFKINGEYLSIYG